jgi:predicted ATP-grasp superfamily ATP-dependent carboligase
VRQAAIAAPAGFAALPQQATDGVNRGIIAAMAFPAQTARPLRVLLSEGSSTSAREAVTVLGLAGHRVEICDPGRHGLARFSRFVAKFHRCPPLRDDPHGYLAFMESLAATGHYGVLLPIHEQGLLFARVPQRFADLVGLALPAFESYRTAHDKARFSALLTELGLPQPATRIVSSAGELRHAARPPCVIKTAIGTASRGVWFLREPDDLPRVMREMTDAHAFATDVLVQDWIPGPTEKAQAVFCNGELIGFHAYRQIARGAGGGDAIKDSVHRARVRADMALIGRHLHWHGALSVDYIESESGARPYYVDCNPRLVEPMAAYLAGTDLVDALLRVSLGETPEVMSDSREGVRTHQAMQALLGCALDGGNRFDLLRICRDIFVRHRAYAGSVEELTPVRLDGISIVPLAMTAFLLLAAPRLAKRLVLHGWGAHLLDARSIAIIENEIGSEGRKMG